MIKVEEIKTLSDNEYDYAAGYFTASKWLDDDNIILERKKKNDGWDSADIIKYTVSTGAIKVLREKCGMCYGNGTRDCVAYKGFVYYSDSKNLIKINADTGESEVIYTYDSDGGDCGYPHITDDGKYISQMALDENGATRFVRINTETKESEEIFSKKFEGHLNVVSHVIVNPKDFELMFFVHEGDTFYISNRLWLYDNRTKKAWNIAKQSLDEDGNLADCYGHEMWAPDGKGLYFIKYPCSPQPPKGICYVDIETNTTELLYSKYPYWHVNVSPDSNFLAADSIVGDGVSSHIVVVDQRDKSETLIDMARTNWQHPVHPHPQISPESSKVVYTTLEEDGSIAVKIACISN